ncbi:hypothetical protein [Streptomyces sp. 135]|uniref:hypothetical protein n=1 Tax=Streptomyces sp. 135 TaxID=2838850 RepID=UPI001CBAD495|nr:hypothetical protein [Streptomyces sp. 135]
MNSKRKIATVAAGVVAIAGLGIGPAFAEGGFSSKIEGWITGKDSRHWSDKNRDGVSTSVKFSGCTAHNGGSGEDHFKHATIQLKKERSGLPDPVVARDNNYCDTSSFGDRSKGSYYFKYTRLNGYDQTGYKLFVKRVVVKY